MNQPLNLVRRVSPLNAPNRDLPFAVKNLLDHSVVSLQKIRCRCKSMQINVLQTSLQCLSCRIQNGSHVPSLTSRPRSRAFSLGRSQTAGTPAIVSWLATKATYRRHDLHAEKPCSASLSIEELDERHRDRRDVRHGQQHEQQYAHKDCISPADTPDPGLRDRARRQQHARNRRRLLPDS